MSLLLGVEPALIKSGVLLFDTLSRYELGVLPLFMLMAHLCFAADASQDFFTAAARLLGHRRGGLALASIGACAAFGAISGSSLATAATIGLVALPEMRKRGYSDALATGTVVAGGTLGQAIPPSGALIVFGIISQQSIGRLFIAAIVPALTQMLLYFLAILIVCRLEARHCAADAARQLVGSRACAAAHRRCGHVGAAGDWRHRPGLVYTLGSRLRRCLRSTGVVRLAPALELEIPGPCAGSNSAHQRHDLHRYCGCADFLGVRQPDRSGRWRPDRSDEPGRRATRCCLCLAIAAILLLLGSLLDGLALMLLTTPILLPVVQSLGLSPIWFGIFLVRAMEIGFVHPPIGMNLYVIQGIAKDVPLGRIFKGVIPFLAADFVHLFLLILFPAMVLALPKALGL